MSSMPVHGDNQSLYVANSVADSSQTLHEQQKQLLDTDIRMLPIIVQQLHAETTSSAVSELSSHALQPTHSKQGHR